MLFHQFSFLEVKDFFPMIFSLASKKSTQLSMLVLLFKISIIRLLIQVRFLYFWTSLKIPIYWSIKLLSKLYCYGINGILVLGLLSICLKRVFPWILFVVHRLGLNLFCCLGPTRPIPGTNFIISLYWCFYFYRHKWETDNLLSSMLYRDFPCPQI